MTELRIRVKPVVKELLESIKEKNGFSINFQVNFAIFKYLILDTGVPYWKLDTRPDPHYETINKMPDEAIELNKFCDGDSCEVDHFKEWQKNIKVHNLDDLKGDKC